ncbi:hypothetical protein SLEP1_g37299 [Rubroshorea leprosula]|uniref:TNase-like domain-containing protein n=1 Tax=Rubroshorea leprosula TaxID=152421 RepID=A0AAV5KUE1_9ROSI|nr:hypothetical protein SLEP1_g37299 [Rubroshorea leprosula]
MGNVLRSLYGWCCKPTTTGDSDYLGPHGASAPTVGVSALAHDLFNFENTSQVPEGLSRHVQSSERAQAECYGKLLEAWREARPPPQTPEEAARLVIQTLERHQLADVEGLLAFYGLPLPDTLIQLSAEIPTSLPEGVQFELYTVPVDARAVGDGDGMTVYVRTESESVPGEVSLAVDKRKEARARKDYTLADEYKQMIIDSGYRFFKIQNGEEILARKCRIRLRGIDAPELEMPYGNEAKEELANLVQGRCLRVLVYEKDEHERVVGDVYCNGIFVQEAMLKRGFAWHFKAFDQRLAFATWEREAREKRVGLWADANPEEPWKWKKRNRREG